MSESLKFKTDFQGDIRVLRANVDSNNVVETLIALKNHCERCYKLSTFDMRYLDDEQDNVTIASVEDLEDAIKQAKSKAKTVKIYVVNKAKKAEKQEEKVECDESVPNEPPKPKSFISEVCDNEEFRKELIATIQTLLSTFRNDENRNLSTAFEITCNTHTMISSHHDFQKVKPFIANMIKNIGKDSIVATIICAVDPAFIPELFEKVFSFLKQGGFCKSFAPLFPLLCGLNRGGLAGMPFMAPLFANLFGGMHMPPPPPPQSRPGHFKKNADGIPMCQCGCAMKKMAAKDAYPVKSEVVICDICDKEFRGSHHLLHCRSGKCSSHPQGYDVCFDCACQRGSQLCKCGITMQPMQADQCYPAKPTTVFCDGCNRKFTGDLQIYHCPTKNARHPNGFDLCLDCIDNPMPPPPPPPMFHHLFGHIFGHPRPHHRHAHPFHHGWPRGGRCRRFSKEGRCQQRRKDNKEGCCKNQNKQEKLQKRKECLENRLKNVESKLKKASEKKAKKEPKKTTDKKAGEKVESSSNDSIFSNDSKPEMIKPMVVTELVSSVSVDSNNSNNNINNNSNDDDENLPLLIPSMPDEPSIPEYVYHEELVSMINMGFDEQQSRAALNKYRGNVQQSVNFILSQ